ncbi:MAG: hypothetical protein LCH52_08710 [Bacteroidetes bacterium]|nr:hypothetical protein [Bacteroidota bacterium]
MNNAFNLLTSEQEKFLNFFKFRFPVFHKSNVFYRDLEYSIKYYLNSRNIELSNKLLIQTTKEFIKHLEGNGILVYMSPLTWMLNYPEFSTVIPVPAETAGESK